MKEMLKKLIEENPNLPVRVFTWCDRGCYDSELHEIYQPSCFVGEYTEIDRAVYIKDEDEYTYILAKWLDVDEEDISSISEDAKKAIVEKLKWEEAIIIMGGILK